MVGEAGQRRIRHGEEQWGVTQTNQNLHDEFRGHQRTHDWASMWLLRHYRVEGARSLGEQPGLRGGAVVSAVGRGGVC